MARPGLGGMSVFLIRPPVAELVFQLYGRPLHPELFDILAVRRYQREDYEVRVWVTRTGHVVTWQSADVLLTELADAGQALSNARRLLSYKMRGEHSACLPCGRGVVYQTSFQVEMLSPEIFLHVHDEILADGEKRGVLHNFQPNHRLAVSPLGHVVVEPRPGRVFVSAFHTFPEENTVVKSQTLIELEG